jgi:alkylation response protein AidB-like acyl-CoA dehydrogenase
MSDISSTNGEPMSDVSEIAEFREQARAWLAANAQPKSASATGWGIGSDGVAVFHDLDAEAERELIARLADWERRKYEAGYGALTWAAEYGGRGLDPLYDDIFAEEQDHFATPDPHELVSVTRNLIAPTLRLLGTPAQREHVIPMLRAEQLCCQLFSEPSAGSDLATLATRVERQGEEWVVNGQKVWSSGAQFAQWGELIARSDPNLPKHEGLTAFLLPMDTPGVEVRPLRQMSGGSSFCEVFLTDVRISDTLRIGEVGGGWKVALTTLGFERGNSSANNSVGGSFAQVLALTQHLGTVGDPLTRSQLAEVYAHEFLAVVAKQRDQAARRGGAPLGAIGSVRKLQWTQKMNLIGQVVTDQLGTLMTADTGEWGTFAWTEHVLGAPGYRIAGGSDEIQRNIISERLLGMPTGPRVDRATPWRELPR